MLPLHVSEMLLLVLPVFLPRRNHFYQKAQPTCTILYSEEQYSSPNLRTQGTVGESLALVWASVSCFQFWLLPQKGKYRYLALLRTSPCAQGQSLWLLIKNLLQIPDLRAGRGPRGPLV